MLPLRTFPPPPLPPFMPGNGGPPGPPPGAGPLAALLAAKARAAAGPAPGGETAAISHLQAAMSALKAYVQVEPDQEDKAVAMTCLANLQKVLAKDQKEQHSALGVTPAHKALARG